jgi:hypothetical protein
VRLVTPITIYTNIGVVQPSIFGFVNITLHFVPEPATLGPVSAGLVWLAAAGWRRARSAGTTMR